MIRNADLSVLLVGETLAERRILSDVLADKRLRCIDQREALRPAMPGVGLILLTGRPDQAALTHMRDHVGPLWLTIPVLACTSGPADATPEGCDEVLDISQAPDVIGARIDSWLPRDVLASARRLAESFGDAAIRPLLERLQSELAHAIASIDSGAGAAGAHGIAGVAGTLGFADVSDAWLRLSEGDGGMAEADARRSARIAIAAIARNLEGDRPVALWS